ncbi:MAG TPA: hypothetical protein VHR45_13660 [Thermoanaerobaculia bacterium]|nr:hypothetical protein [Thermoanaerobaculia bacterium]
MTAVKALPGRTQPEREAIKTWSSCVRDRMLRRRLGRRRQLVSANLAPREGDLVVVRALSDAGAYTVMENLEGREVRLYAGDVVVGVLGTRKSGKNPTGIVPQRPLRRGDVLGLVAVGGLIAETTCTPRYYGGGTLPVEIVGFPSLEGRPANLVDGRSRFGGESLRPERQVLFVAGTSAEVGKTTFLCQAVRCLKRRGAPEGVGAIKACGTGRLRDLLRYADAGASLTVDFVDAGLPSTYNVESGDYTLVLERLVGFSQARAAITLVEVGGDLLEARAPEAIGLARRLRAPVILCVNDAMGALAGCEQLRAAGVEDVTIASMHQNNAALAERLGVGKVVDPQSPEEVGAVVARLYPAAQPGAAVAPAKGPQ